MVKQIATAEAGFDETVDLCQHLGDHGVGGELGVAGVAVHAEGAAVVGVVTAKRRAEIEDEEFTCLGGAVAWWATGGVALVVVASGGEGLAEGGDGGGLQLVENGQLADARGDDFPSPSEHGFARGDGVAEEGEFVGIFAAAKLKEGGFNVVVRRGSGVAEGIEVGGRAARGFDANASGVLCGGVLSDEGGNGMFLILAEGAEPLGLEGDHLAGGVVVGDLIGGDEQALIMREEHGGVVVRAGTVTSEVLDVFGPSEQGEIKLVGGEQVARAGLAVGRVGELHGF